MSGCLGQPDSRDVTVEGSRLKLTPPASHSFLPFSHSLFFSFLLTVAPPLSFSPSLSLPLWLHCSCRNARGLLRPALYSFFPPHSQRPCSLFPSQSWLGD
ncbi:unnamed protein product [Boreogadus saida]